MQREGDFTGKDGQNVQTDTVRQGDRSVTKAEGSGGGSAISASGGLGDRTTIAQSGSGDVYAGHDGNVYRKTDDGWQQHSDGGWSDVDVPDRPEGGERHAAAASTERARATGIFPVTSSVRERRAIARRADSPRYGGSGSLEGRSSADAVWPARDGEPHRGRNSRTTATNS